MIRVALVGLALAVAVSGGRLSAEEPGFPESIRKNYQKQFHYDLRQAEPSNPEITGTRLIIDAMTQLDDTMRNRQIDSTVVLLRNNPDIVESVLRRAVVWVEKNPQMADNANGVLRSIVAQLDGTEVKPKGRFALPGGF